MNILISILALSFLIIVHEFGHFIVAKLSGIKVLEFSLFMGPKLFSIQRGETAYSIRLVPLGGFVKMEGEEESSEDDRAFSKKPIPVRMAVIAAGPIMNLITAVIIIAILVSNSGYYTTEITSIKQNSVLSNAGVKAGDVIVGYNNKKVNQPMDIDILSYGIRDGKVDLKIRRDGEHFTATVIPKGESFKLNIELKTNEGPDSNIVTNVVEGGPAHKAGVKVNDRIVALNGERISSRQDISNFLDRNGEKTVKITVNRNGTEQTLGTEIMPLKLKISGNEALGIEGYNVKKGGIIDNVKAAFTQSYTYARSVYYSLFWLVTGKVSVDQLMGPVGIVTTIGNVVQQSPTILDKIIGLLGYTAFISVNLGLMNLVPFPALDGSKLLLLVIEGIRRKAIPPEKEAVITLVGLALLIMLMIFATSNDIIRLFNKG